MSILGRYTAREILSHCVGVFVVVLSVFLLGRFGKLLGDASEGALPMGTIFALLGLRTLMALPSLMPAVLYLGVLLGLARMYEEREIVACQACGVSPRRLYAITMSFAAAFSLVIAALTFSVRPWAAEKYNSVRSRALARAGLADMSPGRFYELNARGEQVFFAGARSAADRSLTDVFYHQVRDGTLSLITARRAIEQNDPNGPERFIRLYDGYQYEFPRAGRYEVTEFEEMAVLVPPKADESDLAAARERGAWELYTSNEAADHAELQWRLAMPVSALLLVLAALPLSRADGRSDRYARIFVALLLYVAYRLLLGVTKNWVADGLVPPVPGLWLVHGAWFVLGLALLRLAARQPMLGRVLAVRLARMWRR